MTSAFTHVQQPANPASPQIRCAYRTSMASYASSGFRLSNTAINSISQQQ